MFRSAWVIGLLSCPAPIQCFVICVWKWWENQTKAQRVNSVKTGTDGEDHAVCYRVTFPASDQQNCEQTKSPPPHLPNIYAHIGSRRGDKCGDINVNEGFYRRLFSVIFSLNVAGYAQQTWVVHVACAQNHQVNNKTAISQNLTWFFFCIFVTKKSRECGAYTSLVPFWSSLDLIRDIIRSDSTVVGLEGEDLVGRWQIGRPAIMGFFLFSLFFFNLFLSECTVRCRLSLMIENCSVARTLPLKSRAGATFPFSSLKAIEMN